MSHTPAARGGPSGRDISPSDASIIVLQRRHAQAVRQLWDDHLSVVSPRSDVIESATDPETTDVVGFGAERAGELVAFGLLTFTRDANELFEVETFEPTPGIDAAFYLTVVHPEYRHGGLGTDLGRCRVASAVQADADRVVGVAWQAGERIYENLGFERVGSVSDYYDHDPADVTVWRRWL